MSDKELEKFEKEVFENYKKSDKDRPAFNFDKKLNKAADKLKIVLAEEAKGDKCKILNTNMH